MALNIHIKCAVDLIAIDKGHTSDPYVKITINDPEEMKVKWKTTIRKKTLNPMWDQTFEFDTTNMSLTDKFVFGVKDWDRIGMNTPMGTCTLDVWKMVLHPNQAWVMTLQDVKSGRLKIHTEYSGNRHEEAAKLAPAPTPNLEMPSDLRFFDKLRLAFTQERTCPLTVVVDKSRSMAGARWQSVQRALTHLTPLVCRADPDGFPLYFFSSGKPSCHPIRTAECTAAAFRCTTPFGTTDLTTCLLQLFEERKQAAILIITDGAPDDKKSVKEALLEYRDTWLPEGDQPEMSLSFIQVGEDEEASLFLDEMGELTDLDMLVDTMTHEDCKGQGSTFSSALDQLLTHAAANMPGTPLSINGISVGSGAGAKRRSSVRAPRASVSANLKHFFTRPRLSTLKSPKRN